MTKVLIRQRRHVLGPTLTTDNWQLTTYSHSHSIRKRKSNNGKNRLYPVLPGDFLSLFVAAAVVGDADLEDPQAGADFGDFRGDLRLEAEAIALERDLIQHRFAEDLVADFHVGEVEVREHVAEAREEAVAQRVPEVEHAMRLAAHEAAAEDHIRAILRDRQDQLDVIVRVIFQIGILHENDIAGSEFEAVAQSRPFSFVH